MNIYFLLYLLFIVAPIGTFIHESGHALGAKLVKADKVVLSIGLGKIIGTISLRQIEIRLHTFFFIGGFVQSERHLPYTVGETCLISICGPLNNAVFASFLYILQTSYFDNYFMQVLYLFNVWLAIINIIPFKFTGKQSDGYTIVQAINNRNS